MTRPFALLRGLIPVLAVVGIGCTGPDGIPAPLPDHAARMQHRYLYYFDGAGGGTARKNWAEGVRDGLVTGGYPGAGEMFTWETGKGLIADQDASVAVKRGRAREAAAQITRHLVKHPEPPVDLLGFSAGTAVAIFTLEELPASVQVEEVVLLGASLSRDYDLTRALGRIRGRLVVYTSTRDRMLGFLMPFSGTADRKFDDPGAGITGFVLPPGATAATRRLYAEKIITIPWTAEMEKDGDYGRHFNNVKMEFVRDQVTPVFLGKPVPGAPSIKVGTSGFTGVIPFYRFAGK